VSWVEGFVAVVTKIPFATGLEFDVGEAFDRWW